MLSNIKISHRLALGFAIIMLFSGLIGVIAVIGMNKLADLTSTMYSKPFLVTSALNDIQNNASYIHKNMADFILEESPSERNKYLNLTLAEQHKINADFQILMTHFPEKLDKVENLQVIFAEWEGNRNEVIRLIELNDFNSANALVHIQDTENLDTIKTSVKKLIQFERNKANELLTEANSSKQTILIEMYILLTLIFIIGFIISYYISRSITLPIHKIVTFIKPLAQGDLTQEIDIHSKDEIGILANSFRDLALNLNHKALIANKITKGDLEHLIDTKTETDQLGNAMNQMIHSLRQSIKDDKKRLWLNNGISTLNQLMQGEQSVTHLSQVIINHLSEYLGSIMGSIYLLNNHNDTLEFRAGYAFTNPRKIIQSFALGEGYIGQVALDLTIYHLNEIPPDSVKVQSSIIETPPESILFVPVLFEKKLVCVIELAFLKQVKNTAIEFLEIIKEDIGIALNSAKSRNKITKLLLDSEHQSEKLQQQQSALQKTNEELEEQTSNLLESERLLKEQQNELQKNNTQLEEFTESLETQKQFIEDKNLALQAAGQEIESKVVELEKSSRYKSEFLANMSHELRTPLNSLLLLSRMLKENSKGNLNDEQVKSATIIYNAGNDLLSLINDILDLSKIEAGQMDVYYETIHLATLTNAIRRTFSHLIAAKKLSFDIRIDDTLPESFLSDFKRIDQISKNLISNALKFTHTGGIIVSFETLASTVNDDTNYLAISVTDTGIGIAANKISLIFEEFKQAEGGISRNFGGTGLGLSISRKLAELLGGSITLQSQLGIGSTFTFSIPLRKTLPENAIHKKTQSPFANEKNIIESSVFSEEVVLQNNSLKLDDDKNEINEGDMIILIIEDDENFAKVLVDQSRKNGFKALVADNGLYGLQLANKYSPNAILLDIKLPDINGLEVLDNLKLKKNTRHIPVHVMSISEVEHEVSQRGAIGFLQKPINEHSLSNAFQHITVISEKKVKDLLLVEDDKNAQESIKTLIGNSDVVITTAQTGAEAEKEISQKNYDCVVLDLGLSDISGFELLNRLQKNPNITIPPIIIYTGRDLSQKEVTQLREHSQSIIIKGVKSEDRLLDETALFLHRVIGNLPQKKQKMIMDLHDKDAIFKNKTILVVDDDMRNVFALSQLLHDKGFNVIKAEDGEKGLEKLARTPEISIVLMDVMMPKMDGFEAIKQIRSQTKYQDLPIIALTAKAMKEDRENCIAAGANDYLSKPLDVSRLFSMLRVWLYQA